MKKFILSILAIAAMASCTKTSEDDVDPNVPVEIKLGGSITALSKAAVTTNTFTAQVASSGITNNYTTSLWSGKKKKKINVNNGSVTFTQTEYYPNDGGTVYMKGFAPQATINAGQVAYTISGKEDIMVTSEISGSRTDNTNKELTFNHLLTQLKFKLVAEDADAITYWGSITSITVKNVEKDLVLKLNTGELSIATTSNKGDLEVSEEFTSKALTTTPAENGYIMVLPSTTAYVLNIKTAENTQGVDVTISPVVTVKGTAHEITLTFKRSEIASSAKTTPWTTGDPGSGEVK